MAPVSSPSRILTLPAELLIQVLDELEEADLCTLGCACKDLNTFVFSFFFKKSGPRYSLDGYVSSIYQAPKHCLRAVRCCISIRDLRKLCYPFTGGIETHLEELEDMRAIVERAEQIKEFTVNLCCLDGWAADRDSS